MNRTSKIIKIMVRSAIFGAISALPFTRFSLPIFPEFLKIHIDEIPAFIAGFAYGPLVSLFVLIIKTLIGLPFTTSLCVGEAIDLIYSICFVLPTILIYKKINKKYGLIIGIVIGVVLQLLTSFFLNIFVMFPFYCYIYDLSMSELQEICYSVNNNVKDLRYSLGFYIVLPFNSIKDAIVLIVTLLVALPLNPVFKKIK